MDTPSFDHLPDPDDQEGDADADLEELTDDQPVTEEPLPSAPT